MIDFLIKDHQRSLARIRAIYYRTPVAQRGEVRPAYHRARAGILESCMNRRASNRTMEEFRRVDRNA